MAVVNASVTIGEMIFVAQGASIRGDEGQPIFVGDYSNVQDGVVIHGLETFKGDHELLQNKVQLAGKQYWSISESVFPWRTSHKCMARAWWETMPLSACRPWCFGRNSLRTGSYTGDHAGTG